ncbi:MULTISPECIES: calmodulin [Streptomyces]|uniref:BP74 N-terminal domain-containing protein n=1 Tax=Streptomyces luteosporeus TaxID=173856 RepID=A0ABN3U626_9ACTN
MAYFVFTQRPGQVFVFEVTDEEKIAHARKIVSGEETERVHVAGKIVKKKVSYNPDWDFHLDPASIQFFDQGIEVCDANMEYVEDHLDEACGAFLPGCQWCPWDSRVIRELSLP